MLTPCCWRHAAVFIFRCFTPDFHVIFTFYAILPIFATILFCCRLRPPASLMPPSSIFMPRLAADFADTVARRIQRFSLIDTRRYIDNISFLFCLDAAAVYAACLVDTAAPMLMTLWRAPSFADIFDYADADTLLLLRRFMLIRCVILRDDAACFDAARLRRFSCFRAARDIFARSPRTARAPCRRFIRCRCYYCLLRRWRLLCHTLRCCC